MVFEEVDWGSVLGRAACNVGAHVLSAGIAMGFGPLTGIAALAIAQDIAEEVCRQTEHVPAGSRAGEASGEKPPLSEREKALPETTEAERKAPWGWALLAGAIILGGVLYGKKKS